MSGPGEYSCAHRIGDGMCGPCATRIVAAMHKRETEAVGAREAWKAAAEEWKVAAKERFDLMFDRGIKIMALRDGLCRLIAEADSGDVPVGLLRDLLDRSKP